MKENDKLYIKGKRQWLDKALSLSYPRFIILFLDVLLVFISYLIAAFVDSLSVKVPINFSLFWSRSLLLVLVYCIAFLITKSYKGSLRNYVLNDVIRMMTATVASLVALLVIRYFTMKMYDGDTGNYFLSPMLLLSHFGITSMLLIISRLVVKNLFIVNKNKVNNLHTMNTLIYGAGNGGVVTYNAINQDNNDYNVVAFIDDDKNVRNKYIAGGLRVLSPEEALTPEFISKKNISTIIIAIPSLDSERRKEIVDKILDLNLKVKSIPPLTTWINNEIHSSQIDDIQIEDLLGRDQIEIDDEDIKREIEGKCVMVTGAAGTIGSEICQQVLCYNPSKLVMVDQAESPMYDFQFELNNTEKFESLKERMFFEVANIKDPVRMRDIFGKYKPNILYHAGAYKHVPFMEDFPYEAVYVNVFGTKLIADLAVEHKVSKFVMISTDKAVRPANVMGATKRIAEIYIQSRNNNNNNNNNNTNFITTRFGNVLGSSGSVIPLFKKQLAAGGPLTVTSMEIERFFMTIREACSLVLEAGSIGYNDEVFVFDMGEPVKIYKLAENMIRLSGNEGKISIKVIGLRPGEKMYEEPLSKLENTSETAYRKIRIAKVARFDKEKVDNLIEKLHGVLQTGDEMKIVEVMKEIVPEYRSQNSRFSKLDDVEDKGETQEAQAK